MGADFPVLWFLAPQAGVWALGLVLATQFLHQVWSPVAVPTLVLLVPVDFVQLFPDTGPDIFCDWLPDGLDQTFNDFLLFWVFFQQ